MQLKVKVGLLFLVFLSLIFSFIFALAADSYTLTVKKDGNGKGIITSFPIGINCGSTCAASFGGSVTLTAAPTGGGSVFVRWSGDCTGTGLCSVDLGGGNKTVTATFMIWYPTSGPPYSNRPLPATVTEKEQTTAAGKILTLPGGGTLSATNLLTTSLTIDGQIEILSGNPGVDKVLTSDATGLASWADQTSSIPWSIGKGLNEGPGVKLHVDTPARAYTVATASTTEAGWSSPPQVQNRINGVCPMSPLGNARSAISTINEDGSVVCHDLISAITFPPTGGLTGGGSGDLSLSINRGAGLTVSGNLAVNPPIIGSGLILMNDYLQFATSTPTPCTGANVYWKYDATAGRWGCGAPLPAVSKPGGSILYLVAPNSPPINCPTIGSTQWNPVPAVTWTNLGVQTEAVGGTFNQVRTCKYPDNNFSCQVMYLKNPSLASVPDCPSSTLGWVKNTSPTREYADGVATNWVRQCYKCN